MLTIDLALEALVSWPGGVPILTLPMKRRPLTRVPVQFVQGGQIVSVGSGNETGTFAAKVARPVGGVSYIFEAGSWSIVPATATATPYYFFTLSLDNAAIRALFAAQALWEQWGFYASLLAQGWTPPAGFTPPACPVPPWVPAGWTAPAPQPPLSVTLAGEVRWIDGAGMAHNTAPFAIELANEVIDGLTPLLDMLVFSAITALSGGTATDLDAQPTAGLYPYGTLISMTGVTDPAAGALVNAGGLTVWEWQENAAAVTAPGVLVPLDYNALTNPGCWVKVL